MYIYLKHAYKRGKKCSLVCEWEDLFFYILFVECSIVSLSAAAGRSTSSILLLSQIGIGGWQDFETRRDITDDSWRPSLSCWISLSNKPQLDNWDRGCEDVRVSHCNSQKKVLYEMKIGVLFVWEGHVSNLEMN